MLDRAPLIMMRIALVFALLVSTYLATAKGSPVTAVAINDKFAHLATFFALAVMADFSFPRSAYRLNKIIPLLAYGLLIEIIQLYLPYRTFSLLDLVADAAGLALYGVTLLILGRHPIVSWRRAVLRD